MKSEKPEAILFPSTMNDAIFSECGNYRYLLTRFFTSGPIAMCIGLNPSKANSDHDDPTIIHLKNILRALGFGSLYMTNLFGLISPNPEDLRMNPRPIGKTNDIWLKHAAEKADTIIFCWGNFPMAEYRARKIAPMFPQAKCFGKNKNGTPMHPLALMYNGTVKEPKLLKYK